MNRHWRRKVFSSQLSCRSAFRSNLESHSNLIRNITDSALPWCSRLMGRTPFFDERLKDGSWMYSLSLSRLADASGLAFNVGGYCNWGLYEDGNLVSLSAIEAL